MNKLLIGAFASIAIFLASCGSDTKTAKDAHTDGDGHNHATEQVAGNLRFYVTERLRRVL